MKTKEQIANRANEIVSELEGQISSKQVDSLNTPGIEGNSLPAEGVFGLHKVSGKIDEKGQDFRHVRMTVQGSDDSISLSSILLVAPHKDSDVEFGKITKEGSLKGKMYLKGKSVNPQFAKYSRAELIAYLEGSSFSAKKITVLTLPYKAEGWDKPTVKDLTSKEVYQITIND